MKPRAGDACFRISLEELSLDTKFDSTANVTDVEFEVEKPTFVSPVISVKEVRINKMAAVSLYIDKGNSEKAEKAVENIKSLLAPKDGDIRITYVGDTTSAEGWKEYMSDVLPEFGEPKLVVVFGMFSAFPFFRKVAKDNIRWFDNVHTRLHEKAVGEHKFSLFVFPSLDTCLDPEFKSLMGKQLKMVKGMINELGI